MNVLVTGGTGFVGRAVLRELHRAAHEIYFLSRRGHSATCCAIEEECSGQHRSGDILDSKLLSDACAGMDAIIHLAGIISEVGEQTFENVHVRGTQNIVAAAQRAKVKRFVHMSALGTRPNAVARYHQSKWAAEEIVRPSGLDWTIFRPSIIYGPGDGFVNLFASIARRSPVIPVIGNGESKFQPIAVENVARAFVKALSEPRAIGQTFDLAGPEVFTLNRLVDQILEALKRKRLKLHLPLAIARAQAAFLEFVFGTLLRKAPPLNRDQILMLREDNVGCGKPADELFSLKHDRFRDGIGRYIS
jgi:NADH dehydrogenase